MRVPLSILSTFALLMLPFPAVAQESNGSAQEPAVLAAVNGFYTALHRGDEATARRFFHPRAQLFVMLEGRDQTTGAFQPVAEFVAAALTPPPGWWTMEFQNPVVHVSESVAVVLVNFSYRAPQQRRCGTETYQLVRAAAEWQIVSIANRTQLSDCEAHALMGKS